MPSLRFTSTIGEGSAVVRLEHEGEVVPVPVTVTIYYADGQVDDVIFEVVEKVVERTLPLKGRGAIDRGQPRLRRGGGHQEVAPRRAAGYGR